MTAGILVWGYTLLAAEHFRCRHRQRRHSDRRAVGSLASCGRRRCSASICRRWCTACCSSLAVNIACYVGCSLSRRPTSIERVQADVFVPSTLAPILAPMAPSFRLRRASVTVEELIATVARYLGEERTRESFRKLRRLAPHQSRAAGRGRLPAAAIRRISLGVGDRRGLVAAGAVAVVAQAHGLDQGRAKAARRRQCGDPLQPRDFADRARPRAPRHRGVRQGPQSGVLEPPVRRDFRSAARPDPRRHRA